MFIKNVYIICKIVKFFNPCMFLIILIFFQNIDG